MNALFVQPLISPTVDPLCPMEVRTAGHLCYCFRLAMSRDNFGRLDWLTCFPHVYFPSLGRSRQIYPSSHHGQRGKELLYMFWLKKIFIRLAVIYKHLQTVWGHWVQAAKLPYPQAVQNGGGGGITNHTNNDWDTHWKGSPGLSESFQGDHKKSPCFSWLSWHFPIRKRKEPGALLVKRKQRSTDHDTPTKLKPRLY